MDNNQSTLLAGGIIIYVIILIAIIVFAIFLWWRILSKAGYSGALAILMLIPIANFVLILILAFAEWPILRELNMLRQQRGMIPPSYPPYPQGPYPSNPQGPYPPYPQGPYPSNPQS